MMFKIKKSFNINFIHLICEVKILDIYIIFLSQVIYVILLK